MCGRFTNTKSEREITSFIWTHFAVENNDILNHLPQYNITPTQKIWSVINFKNQYRFGSLTWGIKPSSLNKNFFINARSETANNLPTFRHSFATRRCLILADGFYEWDQRFQRKHVYYFYHHQRLPIMMAGLWFPHINARGEKTYSAVLLTTKASSLMRPIHDRLPVMVNPDQYRFWLDPNTKLEELPFLFEPENFKGLLSHQVSSYVNASKHNDRQCIQPIETN